MAQVVGEPLVAPALRRTRLVSSVWRDKFVVLSAVFLLVLIVAAVAAPLVAPSAPTTVSLQDRLAAPSPHGHLLGADGLGRDVLSRLLYGARLSLLIGMSVVVLGGAAGTFLGVLAGYKGGTVDLVIMRVADAQLAFPGLLLVIAVIAMVGPSVPVIVLILTLYGWMIYARLVRGIVLQLRETLFVRAAELNGGRTLWIFRRHLLPNLVAPLITQGMLDLARVILVESSLSYLGMGIQPPNASWGLMVAENQSYMETGWWTVLFPGLAISLTVLTLNLVSHYVRQRTDPEGDRPGLLSLRGIFRRSAAARRAAPSQEEEAPLLYVEGLAVRFDTPEASFYAVRDLDLEVRRGETLGLVGESGSGKSVTSLALMGLVPHPGHVEIGRFVWRGGDLDAGEVERLRGGQIAMVFQDPMTSLNPLMKVGAQIAEVLRTHKGLGRRAAAREAERLLDLVQIADPRRRAQQYPYELSGGMRQRVGIAAALAAEPALLIADEPTTALDVSVQAQILDLVADLQAELGISVLIVSHDLGVIARVADRIAVMYAGRIVEEGPAAHVLAQPSHPYTAALLASTPRTTGVAERLEPIGGAPPNPLDLPAGCAFRERCRNATARCLEAPALAPHEEARSVACWNAR